MTFYDANGVRISASNYVNIANDGKYFVDVNKIPGRLIRPEPFQLGEVYRKYCNGDSITDFELETGIRAFTELEQNLSMLGETFNLPANEIRQVVRSLKAFKRFREEKR